MRAALFLLLFAWMLDTYSLEGASVPSIDKAPSDKNTKDGTKDKKNSDTKKEVTVTLPSAGNVTVSGKLGAPTQQTKSESDGKKHDVWDWVTSFIFDIKITDFFIALFTGLLFFVGRDQLRELRKTVVDTGTSANAAKKSAEVAEDTLVATHRPWLSVNVEIAGPMTFANGPCLPLKIISKNIGKTPAIKVTCFAKILPVEQSIIDILETMKQQSSQFGTTVIGHMLFPEEVYEETHSTGGVPIEYVRTPIPPFLFVCVKYGLTFNDETHQTAAMFGLVRTDTPGTQLFATDLPTAPIPAMNLLLFPASRYAD